MQRIQARVVDHAEFGAGYRRLALRISAKGFAPVPGQFVHLRIPGLEPTALRRPFSIFDFDRGTLALIFKPVGRGTRLLETVGPGDNLDLLGPLGNGFPSEPSPGAVPVLVGGGYGAAPLHFLARRMPSRGHALLGARNVREILCAEEFEALGWKVHVATEDGSAGLSGMVTDLLDLPEVASGGPREWFGCGPEAMLRVLGERAVRSGITAWISLDKRMGCGIGACLACVQAVRDANGRVSMARVCRDGPVFKAEDIVWGRP